MGARPPSTHLLSGDTHVRDAAGDDEAIARLASRQHGIAGRRQLLELGIGRRAVARRLEIGRLRPLHAGVYAVGHEALTHRGRALAAAMSVAPDAAVSHIAAAALWGLCDPPAGPVHLTAIRARRPRAGIVIHRATLPGADVSILDGIPVTCVPRTLLDLSATTGEGVLRGFVRDAPFRGLVSRRALEEILERYPRRRGRRNLARIVGGQVAGEGRTRSELEHRFLRFCAERGLPLPETNVVLEVRGRRLEVDCVWREARLVVELDGRQAHGTDAAFQEDRARDRLLIAADWAPMRVTWGHIHHHGDTLETEIRDALSTRTPHRRRFGHLIGA